MQGSAEALKASVEALSDDEVSVNVVATDVGPITVADIDTARITNSKILAFNVKSAVAAVDAQAKHSAVQICQQKVIYHMLEQVSLRTEA